ncbi:hypothetical protein BAE44_0001585 [Dichanthelium oligosanthes]|uniref:Gfo/Idh/MocA-like oxidoreductase N-terminal domain-containing protein n=1 Tax=Dichanthelium oligosanthes TaxID=888268 RepID=A0A1E5WJ15_9POAL|nr:hypothetical protein BAE44_0001585 [Dichanthelium oligosanthes]
MAGDGDGRAGLPRIAVVGAGIFARTQYIPRLREIAHLVVLKAIWSRTEESAKAAAELARDFAPEIECKWGDAGLEEIMGDSSIMGVAVVLAGQVQVELSLKMLKAGKHVIQATTEAETALSIYSSFPNQFPYKPIWALGENYRFEPAFVESSKLIKDIGDMMHIQVIIEGSMNSTNPYFNSSWRRNFVGGFILDMGVHFIAGLRTSTGKWMCWCLCICSQFKITEEFLSSLVITQILWRVDGTKGTIQVERGVDSGKHGYQVLFTCENGQCQKTFYPFCGVNEELKAFVHDMLEASKDGGHKAEPRSSYVEGARDVAVLEAMLESSEKQGAPVQVKRF